MADAGEEILRYYACLKKRSGIMWGCDWNGFSAGTGGWGMGFGFLNIFFVLLVLFVLVYVLYRLLRSSRPVPNGFSDQRDSLHILKSRLARGEISLEEYWQMHQVLAPPQGRI